MSPTMYMFVHLSLAKQISQWVFVENNIAVWYALHMPLPENVSHWVDFVWVSNKIYIARYALNPNNVSQLSGHFEGNQKYHYIWRGVRSGVQLSCTETLFQKCSQSSQNGSEHPMKSISMAYNVISRKKIERNTQKIKIADFTIAIYSIFGIGMVYFRCLQVNPHIQVVQNMCSKGG